jgi:hypothetical protein
MLGQDETTGVTMEERNVEIPLQGTDAAAERGLIQVEPFTSPGKAPGFRYLIEEFDLVPIQGSPSQ